MDIAITIVHVVACFFLIIVVLLQTGKGADIGAVFGGSSQTVFGSGGAASLLTRLTTYTAIIFMITSLFLTWVSTRSLTLSVADDIPIEPPPLVQPVAPAAEIPASDEAANKEASSENEAAPAAAAEDQNKAEGAPADNSDTPPSEGAPAAETAGNSPDPG